MACLPIDPVGVRWEIDLRPVGSSSRRARRSAQPPRRTTILRIAGGRSRESHQHARDATAYLGQRPAGSSPDGSCSSVRAAAWQKLGAFDAPTIPGYSISIPSRRAVYRPAFAAKPSAGGFLLGGKAKRMRGSGGVMETLAGRPARKKRSGRARPAEDIPGRRARCRQDL